MSNVCLVTGANGHLGNNLVRELLEKGETVRAGVRDIANAAMLDGLDCDLVHADMLNQASMETALSGVDVLYHVAAVFKHWAKNPEQEIVQANLLGTEIVLAAAAKAKVKKIIYVSSVAAIGHDGTQLNEESWNQDISNHYYRSKIASEKRAWELAQQYNLWMVVVLPSAMVGPNISRLTDTMQFIENIRTGALSIDPSFFFNFVDVRDVAEAMYAASIKGKSGNRYILANKASSPLSEILNAVNSTGVNVSKPPALAKWILYFLAGLMELGASVSGKPAELIRSQVSIFYKVRQEYSISKAEIELGYNPKTPYSALVETFNYLAKRES